jgi:hypothetical protein
MLSDKYLQPVPELTPVHEMYKLALFQEPVTLSNECVFIEETSLNKCRIIVRIVRRHRMDCLLEQTEVSIHTIEKKDGEDIIQLQLAHGCNVPIVGLHFGDSVAN